MPGTIVVSVLDVDLPTTSQSKPVEGGSNPDSVSLKVSMGKREYLAKGRADFSFPVLSLRENLIIALQEADGSEISQTDIKTMSVVEKGLIDSWFSFDGGGTAHLKLQFIVSSEEQKRIKEMREAALKRKQGKLFVIGQSFSEVNKRALTVLQKVNQASRPLQKSPESREELATALQREAPEHPSVSQDKRTFKAPFSAPDVHAIDQPSKVSLNSETLETPSSSLDIRRIDQPYQDSQNRVTIRSSPEIHKVSQPPEVPRVKFGHPTTTSVRRNVVTTLPSSSFRLEDVEKILTGKKKETSEISVNNVKKMISAFETSLSQDKSELRPHNGSISSCLKKIESAGSFTEISDKVQADETMVRSFSAGMLSEMNLEQSEQYKTPNKREQEGEYNFAINQNARDLDFNQSIVCDRMKVADQLTKSSEAVNFGASEIDIEPCKLAGIVDDSRDVDRPIICDRVADTRQPIEKPQLINLGATEGDSESCILSRDEQRHKPSDESYREDTTESSICRTCNLVRDIVPEACHPGYPELWIKRHLCITTATQQSVNFIGGFDIPAGPCSTENELTEHMEQGDSSAGVNKIKNISLPEKPNHERYPGIPSFNGKLLEQVVQFAVIAVACGVLVLRNR